MKDLVQLRNPRSGHYILIDRVSGTIKGRSKKPYKGVPIVTGD